MKDDDINFPNQNHTEYECINVILFDELKIIEFIDLQEEEKEKLIQTAFKTCLYLSKYDLLQKLINKNWIPETKLIYLSIKEKNIAYIQLLNTNKISLDVNDEKGRTPIEYALELYMIDKTYYEYIIELNKYKYIRNPKYWNMCIDAQIYDDNSVSVAEDKFLQKLKTIKPTSIKELTILIIEYSFETNELSYLEKYIKHYKENIDLDMLFDKITSYHSILFLRNIYELFIEKHIMKVIECCLQLNDYDTLLIIKDKMPYDKYLSYVIKTYNVRGLIFVAEYIGYIKLATELENKNSIIHLLSNSTDDRVIDIQKCFKIIRNYAPYLINTKNINGETPIFSACNNHVMTELLLMSGAIVTYHNELGDTFLHHIIRNGSFNVFKKALLYHSELINVPNKQGETLLILACKLQKKEICNYLILLKADETICDNDGNNISHYVCLYGLDEIPIKLQENKNKFGHTQKEYLIAHIHQHICNF